MSPDKSYEAELAAGAIALSAGAMAFSAGAVVLVVSLIVVLDASTGAAGLLQAATDRAATAAPATRTLRIRSEVIVGFSFW